MRRPFLFAVLFLFLTLFPLALSKTAKTPPPPPPDPAQLKLASFSDITPGCNLNLCFALESSRHITPAEYNLQVFFILDILAAIAGNGLEVSAAQYGDTVTPISRLTNSTEDFIQALLASQQNEDEEGRIFSGVRWCHETLLARVGEVGKIVVLGSDGATVGGERAAVRADKVRRDGFDICMVGVGYKNDRVLEEIAGARERVFEVDGFFDLADLVSGLVEMVCGKRLLR